MRNRSIFAALILLLAALPASSALHRVALKPSDWAGALRTLNGMQADIAGADHQAGVIEVIADDAFLPQLTALGIPMEVRQTLREGLRAPGLDLYTDPEELETALFDLAAQYPDLMEVVVLADDLFEGQTVYAVKLGSSVIRTPKPVFLVDAQHHAREVMTPEIALDMIEYLLANYGIDPKTTRWMDEVEIWVVPSVNPDGAMFAFTTNNWWRRNRHKPCFVDLNRNYPYKWGACNGSSGQCWDDTYRGETPGSEPETQGMLALMYAIKPQFYLTYHSYGQYIIYPFGCGRASEESTFRDIAQGLNAVLEDDQGKTGKYSVGNSEDVLYKTDGSSDDEPYANLGTFPYCIEVNSDAAGGFQPAYTQWRDVTVRRQRAAWGFFLDRILEGPQVRGTVRDPLRQGPLPGAVVTVEGLVFSAGEAPRTTDSDGRYFVMARQGQTLTITFSCMGYAPATRSITVGEGPVDLDVTLQPIGKLVAGKSAVEPVPSGSASRSSDRDGRR